MKIVDPVDDFVPGDDVCRSCTGITYISQAMKENRKVAWCIGMRKTEKFSQQRLEQLEKEAEKDFAYQISVGYTLSTRHMDRTGYAPVALTGFTFGRPSYADPSRNTASLNDSKFIENREVTEQSRFEQAAALTTGFYEIMSKGIELQANKTMVLVRKVSTPAFAQKFYRHGTT